jgi:hypothetical protein
MTRRVRRRPRSASGLAARVGAPTRVPDAYRLGGLAGRISKPSSDTVYSALSFA